MSENTQPQVIHFVKIRSWYIPADAESYRILVDLKVPLVKLHQDLIPTLQLATKPKGIRAKATPFKDIQIEFLDRIGETWLKQPGRKCSLGEKESRFSAPANRKNRKAIDSLDRIYQGFCARWGFSYHPIFSETPKDLKLVLRYKFDPERNPIVPSVVPVEKPVFEIELGFTRIRITLGVQRLSTPTRGRGGNRNDLPTPIGAPTHILEVATKAGTGWVPVHTGSFTAHTVGGLNSFLGCLGNLHSQKLSIT